MTPYYEDAWAYGGIPRVASTLSRGLARRGHRVSVYTTDACDRTSRLRPTNPRTRGPTVSPVTPTSNGVAVRIFPNVSNRLAYDFQFFVPIGLRRYLRHHALEFDVAHLHGCHHLPGAIALRTLRRAGIPCVLAPNGTAPRIERRRVAKWVFDATLGRGVISGASRVLAVTESERGQLLRLGVNPTLIRLVPNPVDTNEFAEPPDPDRFRRRLGIHAKRTVLFLGKITPRKRVDLLIEAFAALGSSDTWLVIVGNDFGMEPSLRRLVEQHGLAPRTVFTGLLRGRERLDALAAADVVVYPSRDEIFGLVPLEALLCGSPVIVADDSGCGEVIGRVGGGLVVPQGDPARLTEAIRIVLAAPSDWRRAAASAKDRVAAAYGTDSVCAQLEAVYRELVPVAAGNR